MIEFLKQYQELITLFFTIAVGISTIFYVRLTAKLVNETRKMRKSQTDPEISISLVQNPASIIFIDLLVENIGITPAYKVKFEIINDFKLNKGMLSEVGFMKNGINYFSPKQSMRLWVASFKDDKELEHKIIEIRITYCDAFSNIYTRYFVLNFSQFASFTQLGTPPLQKISEKIESIEKSLNNITSGFQRLKVDIYDNDDREHEHQKLEEEHDKLIKPKEEKSSI